MLTLVARRCSATCCRWRGIALALRPDFLALALLYWCIQAAALRRRRRRLVRSGLLMDVGDGALFGQHALAYAVLAYARRVLRAGACCASRSWQQALQVAVLLALGAALVLLVRFVGGAPLPRWTCCVAAAGRRAAVAGGLGRAAVAAAAGALAAEL
ncbi:MAG: rod shape-determining protein MreD [Comamonadaceae bacterium]|nr:rod shape-determining protein MreD [Comamonadaceae bacterium]